MKIKALAYRLILSGMITLPWTASSQDRSVIQRAMVDEMKRSMNELRLDSLKKPFYISYTITDVKVYSMAATLGALVNSVEGPTRTKGLRVLVGGYEFNDESLDNNLFSSPEANEIALPLDNDYIGIRRSLWVTTDKVYRDAARQFEKNTSMLKDTKKPLAEVPHRTFGKTTPVQINTDWTAPEFDKGKWEENLRQWSARFIKTDEPNSSVALTYVHGYEYFVNSEGTSITVPVANATLRVFCQGKNNGGEIVFDQASWRGRTPAELPTPDQLHAEITLMIKRVDEMKNAKPFGDEYNGPVLIEGAVVAQLFDNVLFQGREQLLYDNAIPNLSGFRADRSNAMDTRLGKSIASTLLTVKAVSRLQKYKGVDLPGAYEADQEGVVPPDELVLIEKGTLKNLLNDRTLTGPNQTPNGHNAGPGVVHVSLDGSVPQKELKQKLIEQARAEGLEYALIVRNNYPSNLGVINVYRVTLATGQEELLRAAEFQSLSLKNLRKLVGSSEEAVHHLLSTAGNGSYNSYIVPQALLLGTVDIQHADIPTFKEEEFVSSPLKR